MNITTMIKNLRQSYVEKGLAPNFYEINNGLCEEFALELLSFLGGYDKDNTQYELQGECFMKGINGETYENDIWDSELLETKWNIKPPLRLSWEDLNQINFGCHVWLYYNGLHYDAECSTGVQNFFDLPLFKRYILDFKRLDNHIDAV